MVRSFLLRISNNSGALRIILFTIIVVGLLVDEIDAAVLRGSSAVDASASPCKCDLDDITGYCKPGFQVIGVQKSGTSTLYHLMEQHPKISPPDKKELLWFNGNFEDLRCATPGEPTAESFSNDYLGRFPKLSPDDDMITGEWSATSFHCSCCPAAFRRLMPHVRLIVILRDPIDRAISRYDEQHLWFSPPYDTYDNFDTYVEAQLPALQKCLGEKPEAMGLSRSVERDFACAGHHDILGSSLYAAGLQTWTALFKKFLVLYLDDLEKHPETVMTQIEDFLGLSPYNYTGLDKKYNPKGKYGWNNAVQISQPTQVTLEKLLDFYKPSVKAVKGFADKGKISPMPKSWIKKYLK